MKISILLRSPTLPILISRDDQLFAVNMPEEFEKTIKRKLHFSPEQTDYDVVDVTGEGFKLQLIDDTVVLSPLTLKKDWTKKEIIKLFNESTIANRFNVAYPIRSLSSKLFKRILSEIAIIISSLYLNRDADA